MGGISVKLLGIKWYYCPGFQNKTRPLCISKQLKQKPFSFLNTIYVGILNANYVMLTQFSFLSIEKKSRGKHHEKNVILATIRMFCCYFAEAAVMRFFNSQILLY